MHAVLGKDQGRQAHAHHLQQSYAAGEPIGVVWKNAPANRWGWLGVYKASAADPRGDSYLIWQYTGGAASGTMAGPRALALDDTAWGKPWPLPPGKYKEFYLLADSHRSVAAASFTVTM